MARILGSTTNPVEPSMALCVPKGAIERLLANVGWKIEDVDLFEINEAFSSQLVVLIKELVWIERGSMFMEELWPWQ
jgi:acetyl-CoA C-acetyltransferase